MKKEKWVLPLYECVTRVKLYDDDDEAVEHQDSERDNDSHGEVDVDYHEIPHVMVCVVDALRQTVQKLK